MAIVWAFRAAVAIAPAAYRWAATGGSPPTQGFTLWLQEHWRTFVDPTKSAIEIVEELQATLPEGSFIAMADFTAPFETRKLSLRFSRTPPTLVAEDVDVVTMSFLKAPGGTPTDAWDTSDYTTLETALGTLWNSLKVAYPNYIGPVEYRWYADGPAFHPAPTDGNPARRVTTPTLVVGSVTSGATLPPQDAISVTFKTDIRKHWGRVYMPAPAVGANVNLNGTLADSVCDLYRGAFVTFFNAARAASLVPVVFSLTASTAFGINSVQVDDLIDVMRKRRWKRAAYKTDVALT